MISALTMDTLRAYVEHHVPTGSFLEAVISNDLLQAYRRADPENREALFEIVSWLINHAPIACWGSRAAYEKWVR